MLVTDVDNTLFDWVSMWDAAYTAQLREVLRISGVAEDELLAEIREIHQRHGTSEYAFLLEDLTCLRRPGETGEDVLRRFRPAMAAFETARERSLHLYPGVRETLEALRSRGVFLVGYTESLASYSIYRMRRLGLDGLLHVLYSPPDRRVAVDPSQDRGRRRDVRAEPMRETTHRHTLPGERKPSPDMLAHIVAAGGGEPESTAYVGDSLLRDVSMAQEAGVSDVLAEYGRPEGQERAGGQGQGRARGQEPGREAYELLDRLTHWTDAEIEREREFVGQAPIVPSYVLRESFAELLDLFEFVAFRGR